MKNNISNEELNEQSRKTDVKCRFFMQYYGQEVFAFDNEDAIRINSKTISYVGQDSFLRLKPLFKIKDEDALNAIRICKVYVRKDGTYVTEHVPIENIKSCFQDVPVWRLDVADYLRSKGYALPFMEHSVDELVEMGWVQLV